MKFLVAAAVLVAALAILYVLGPREPVDLTVSVDRDAIAADPVAYLAEQEGFVDGIRDGLQKEIVYAFPNSRAKTPLALVYVHGFSASKNELRPVPDRVAEELEANLFYMRLAGHGRDGDAMGEATVNAWINDLAEAIAISEELGERIVLIGTSTGASLATLAATEPGLRERIDGIVQVSPNFALTNWKARILDFPFAEQILSVAEGPERSFEPVNAMHAANWTSRYPTRSLLPMAALTREVRRRPLEAIRVPTLFVFDEADTVVNHEATRRAAARWGSAYGTPAHIELLHGTDDPYRHVIAGDSLSPSTTERAVEIITPWISALGAQASASVAE